MPTDISKTISYIFTVFLVFLYTHAMNAQDQTSNFVSLIKNTKKEQLDVFINGNYFTSYLYKDAMLRKPVLFPLFTANAVRITRGFPITPNPNERVDHPHHYGLWFNHGDVNGVDYWNSAVIPKHPDGRYGSINHLEFLTIESGNIGVLEVKKEWYDDTKKSVMTEHTHYTFEGGENKRIITLKTTLTAKDDITFKDSKEGLFALRVRRELETPSDKPALLLDENLKQTKKKITNNTGVSGHFQNSNGIKGYPEVWGKRAKWMLLEGKVNNDSITICIFDHKENPNHPPHWMARDYGLFAVNSLGSNIYTKGKEQFNLTLKKGESVKFKHQVVIIDTVSPSSKDIDLLYQDFMSKY